MRYLVTMIRACSGMSWMRERWMSESGRVLVRWVELRDRNGVYATARSAPAVDMRRLCARRVEPILDCPYSYQRLSNPVIQRCRCLRRVNEVSVV